MVWTCIQNEQQEASKRNLQMEPLGMRTAGRPQNR
jgi:hypothetical protein